MGGLDVSSWPKSFAAESICAFAYIRVLVCVCTRVSVCVCVCVCACVCVCVFCWKDHVGEFNRSMPWLFVGRSLQKHGINSFQAKILVINMQWSRWSRFVHSLPKLTTQHLTVAGGQDCLLLLC